MNTNTDNHVRKVIRSTAPATAAVSSREAFLGIDAADRRQVVTQIVGSESPKPAQGMTSETLVKRVAQLLKTGFRVHCVYAAGERALRERQREQERFVGRAGQECR